MRVFILALLVYFTAFLYPALGQDGRSSESQRSEVLEPIGAKPSEREKWEINNAFREREIRVKERELDLKQQELASSGLFNPLFLAIVGATIAAIVNIVVAFINGIQQRKLEDAKSEQTRILEMIKAPNADKAAENLQFLLNTGLITGIQTKGIQDFLDRRPAGSGPVLGSQVLPMPDKEFVIGWAKAHKAQNPWDMGLKNWERCLHDLGYPGGKRHELEYNDDETLKYQ